LSNWVKLQENAAPRDELIFSVVGWHALTLPQNAKDLYASRRDTLAALLAIGIDPHRSIVFHQDQVRNMLDKRIKEPYFVCRFMHTRSLVGFLDA
jgi:tryptophanyl-tRNA synthetase